MSNQSRKSIDAIVVPTHRPIAYLDQAVELARQLNCPIVVLCSGESKAARVAVLINDVAGAAVTVASTPHSSVMELRTGRPRSPSSEPYLDTANKRNVGLLLGRLLGWQRLLFLDDDIRGLSAETVRQAAAAVAPAGLRVVGWSFPDFPDNSVVCHALRGSGAEQDVFIGAGALLVELTGWLPFFPAVYNEDWLFWHDFAVRQQIGRAGDTGQIAFDPFADPHRAAQEEFGDVLAEGLYALIHQRRSVYVGCFANYWTAVIRERARLLADIDCRLRALRDGGSSTTWDGHEIAKVLRSVAASREALNAVTSEDLAEFTSLWRFDLFCWNARLHHLPRVTRIVDALNWLEITDVHLTGDL